MKPAPFDYVAPRSVSEACTALSDAAGGATILAGGQTLMPLLALRMSQPFILIDIGRIPELKGVTQSEGGVRVGAMTRQCDALANDVLARELPVIVEALRYVGHHQTRNRGTVGGSVALGEPAAEMPAAAIALDASIEAHSTRGSRRISARAFYLAPYMTVLEPDELVTAIHYPAWPKGHLRVFRELAQRPGDFALSGVVGALATESGAIARAGLAWFGMGPTPILARQAMDALIGKKVAEVDVNAIADLGVAESAPFDDHHASAEYRRVVGKRVFARALQEALSPGRAA